MKAIKVVLSAVLTTILIYPAFGQYAPTETMKKQEPAKKDMAMCKPDFESTVEGTHLKVWVMLETDHEKMMKSMKPEEKSDMDKTKQESKSGSTQMDNKPKMTVTAMGTHYLKVEATDASTGVYAKNLTGKAEVISPSKKSTSVELKSATNHAGCDLTLNEKGAYQISLNLNVDGKTRTAKFDYTPIASQAMNEE